MHESGAESSSIKVFNGHSFGNSIPHPSTEILKALTYCFVWIQFFEIHGSLFPWHYYRTRRRWAQRLIRSLQQLAYSAEMQHLPVHWHKSVIFLMNLCCIKMFDKIKKNICENGKNPGSKVQHWNTSCLYSAVCIYTGNWQPINESGSNVACISICEI